MKATEWEIKNAEFRIAFCETNLRYLLGENIQNMNKIENCKRQVQEAKDILAKLIK